MNDEAQKPPSGFRVVDLARSLRVPRATLYAWIRAGKLPAVRVGEVLIILEADLSDFLTRHRCCEGRGKET